LGFSILPVGFLGTSSKIIFLGLLYFGKASQNRPASSSFISLPGLTLIMAATISPSHGFAQIITIGDPVTIQGLDIADGDLIHADRHGAVIIPAAALLALPAAIDLVMRKVRPLIEASKRAGFSVADLRLAMAEADDIH
jgi:hypothetical protein